jgi:sphingolipid 4-desaturase/C4-monooxygenase
MSTSAVAWHTERHAKLLRKHPRIRELFGPDMFSVPAVAALVVVQLAIAFALRDASWVAVIAAAYLVGAVFSHALGVLIHEATHNLVTRRTTTNKLWALVANVPLVAPVAVAFRHEHLLHHRFLGDAGDKDTQAPTTAEARFVGTSTAWKLLSFTFGRFFYKGRPAGKPPLDRWLALNAATQGVAMAVLVGVAGVRPLVYLLVAALAAFGPHPLGARRLSEHLAVLRRQPTYSYYGVLNLVSFNVGYHVEHHDFPAVAWRRLPRLQAMARADYDGLFWIRSWTLLLVEYLARDAYRVDHYLGMGPTLEEEAKGRLETLYGSDARWASHPHDDDPRGEGGPWNDHPHSSGA